MNEHSEVDVEFISSHKGIELPKQQKSISQNELLEAVTFLSIVVSCGIVLFFALTGCSTTPAGSSPYGAEKETPGGTIIREDPASQNGETKLGIRLEGLRLSAAGYVLDFRYRVIDPVRAAPLLDRKIRPYLLDEASGAQLGVPDTAKLGQLRTTGRNRVIHDRDYFILFANPGRFVQAGSKMTLVMGDVRIENLTVE